MNIVLIGYRGTGKSVVGKLIAKYLKIKYLSTDEMIVKKAGMSIPKIVEDYGWIKFREIESEIVSELTNLNELVIDTGGGVIERDKNINLLQVNSYIIWLKATVETIVLRIEKGTDRPSLTNEKSFTKEVAEVLEKRVPKYKSASQYSINTDNLTPEQIMEQILKTVPFGKNNA